ncbi:MAG: cation diffusion facilitator family transporter [Pseudomonadota bacterium]
MPLPEPSLSADRQAILRQRAATASLATAIALVLIKLGAVIVTGSVAVLSTLLDSAADVVAALVTLIGVSQAAKPADRKHRFGHGKADALSALAHGVFIAAAGLLIVADAGRRLLVSPEPVAAPQIGLFAMIACFAITGLLVLYQRHVVRQAGSQAIRADCLNHIGDLLTMAAVFLSLLLSDATGLLWVDPLAALLIAIWLFFNATRVTMSAIDELMDRELPATYREKVESLITDHPHVHDLHDLRTRGAGPTVFIDVHCEIDGSLSLDDVHKVMDEIEEKLDQRFPNAEIVIHPEPAGIDDDRLDDRLTGT